MKKKLDLPKALQEWADGKKVTAVLDKNIATLALNDLKVLDDIGADFLIEVPDEEAPSKPAITIEGMEGDILESPPRR